MLKYECILCNMWDIFIPKQHLLFIWNSNLLGPLYFYWLNLVTLSLGWSWRFWRKGNQFSFWKLLTWGQRSSSFRHHLAIAPAVKLCPKHSFRICGGSLAPTEQGKFVQRDRWWGLNFTQSCGDELSLGTNVRDWSPVIPQGGHDGHPWNPGGFHSTRSEGWKPDYMQIQGWLSLVKFSRILCFRNSF